MTHVWQRLVATALILGAVVTLALFNVINGDAAIGIIGLAAGLWFGQFIPSPIGAVTKIEPTILSTTEPPAPPA